MLPEGAAEDTRRRHRELVYSNAIGVLLHAALLTVAFRRALTIGAGIDGEWADLVMPGLFERWKAVRAAAREVRLEMGFDPVSEPPADWPHIGDDQLERFWQELHQMDFSRPAEGAS
jgi:hypothetical protein